MQVPNARLGLGVWRAFFATLAFVLPAMPASAASSDRAAYELSSQLRRAHAGINRVTFSVALTAVQVGRLEGVALQSVVLQEPTRTVDLHLVDGRTMRAAYPRHYAPAIIERLEQAGVPYDVDAPKQAASTALLRSLPWIALIALSLWAVASRLRK